MSILSTASRFRLLQLRRLRRHRLRAVLSVLGVATGVALVVAVATVLTSVSRTAESVADLGRGSAYEVLRPGGFDEGAVAGIESVDGVTEVSRLVHLPVLINGDPGWLVAAEPAPGLEGLGRRLAEIDGVRSGSSIPASGTIRITGADGTTTHVEVDGPLSSPLADRFGGRFVVAPLATAVELSGLGQPTSVLVFGDLPRDGLVAAAGLGASVQTAEDKVAYAEGALAPILASLLLIALLGIVVGIALVFNTVNANALENRNEVAALRALGSDRRSARLGAILEALLIGFVGSIVGLVFGLAMGSAVVGTVPDAFSNLIGSTIEPAVPPWLPVLGLVAGTGLALASAIGPIRSAGRIEPIQGIRSSEAAEFDQARTSWPLLAIGAVMLGASALVGGGLGVLLAAVGAIGLLRSILPRLTRATATVAGKFGPSGRLAALGLARSPRRVWSTTLVVLLAGGISLMTIGALNDFARTSEADLSTAGRPTFWVSTVSGDNVPVIGLPSEWTAQLAAIDGVTEVAATRLVSTGYEGRQIGVLAVEGDSAYSFYALAPAAAREAVQEGSAVIINRQFADVYSLSVGDQIQLPAAGPDRQVSVTAVTEGVAMAEGGLLVVSGDTLRSVYGIDSFASYEVTAAPGRTVEVQAQISSLAGEAGFPVRVIPSGEFLTDALISVVQIRSLMGLILLVVALCAGIAAFNTFAAAIVLRQREFAMLRALGTTRRRIATSVIIEAIAIGIVAGLLGAALGAYLHYLASDALQSFFHIEYRFSPTVVVLSVLLSITIVTVSTLLPVRRSTTGEVVDRLAFER